MKKDLKEIEKIVSDLELNSQVQIREMLSNFLQTHLTRNKIDKFIGDYPTFIEPVHLEENVKIGDDVLLGPNVYIGKNSDIKDYVEISNSVLFDNVIIGENIKLDNCIIGKNALLSCENISVDNCVIVGNVRTKEELYK
ncbi:MAG: NDP-sugar synthase, partial [Candidatus Lokiarchaeota archaeon]|nr:NDP-sugar synthase [Candidatus Lokiarchaeota archaeon]